MLLFTPLGQSRNNATRWIGVGDFTIMPGEVAKIAAIIFVAWYLSRDPKRIRSFTRGILPLIGLCALDFGLIILQPNLSTAITICGIIIGMMFVAGLNILYLGGIIGLGALGITYMILTDEGGYRMKRLTSFLDPFQDPLGDGYQVIQSLLALGSGGLFGVGLGKSIQKTLYLPEPQNDFIFAIIGEELGFYRMPAAHRMLHRAYLARDPYCPQCAGHVRIPACVRDHHHAFASGHPEHRGGDLVHPPTGITLPFVSYGGNALVLFMGCMGILLNISRHSAR
jgi:cell division protein FtsW